MSFQRNNVDTTTRLKIGLEAHSNKGIYGGIVDLARRYRVSRWFVYFCLALVTSLENLDRAKLEPTRTLVSQVSRLEDVVLTLYLDCEASLSGIQRSLANLYGIDCSTGQISEILNRYGALLPDTDKIGSIRLCLINDEIFGNGKPALVTIDLETLYIVQLKQADKRDAETWGICWLEIVGENGQVERVAADMAKGIIGGVSLVFPKVIYQADLLHVLMPLAFLVWYFERQAYAAIKAEYDIRTAMETAVYGKTRVKYEALYPQARATAIQKIDLYDAYLYLFRELQAALQVVDEETGRIRTGAAARETLAVVLDLMLSLNDERLTERVGNFRSHLDDLLRYFDQAAKVDQALQESVPDEAVRRELIRLAAWEIKARQTAGESLRRLKERIACWKAILSEWLSPDRFQRLYMLALKGLSTIVRSSSMVENLNSRLRRFFDSARGQLNQNRLNLIRFYLNRKVFTRGWRKGRSPRQMFTSADSSISWLNELHAMANA